MGEIVIREDNLVPYRTGQYLPCRNLCRYKNTNISYRFKYRTYWSYFDHTAIYTGFRLVNGYRTGTKLHTKCFFPSPHASHTFCLPSFLTLFTLTMKSCHLVESGGTNKYLASFEYLRWGWRFEALRERESLRWKIKRAVMGVKESWKIKKYLIVKW